MPRAVVVRERTADVGEHVRSNGLIERRAKSAVREYAQLPGKAASLDSAVVRRRIRRPVEPRGDGEIRGGNLDRGSCDSVSLVKPPRATDSAGDVRRASQCPGVTLPREVFHESVRQKGLHVIGQGEAIGARGRGWCKGCNLNAVQ